MTEFEEISRETAWEGRIAKVETARYRYADGGESDREIVRHTGAVGVVAYDDETLWLVRQPREAIGDPALLELPAGKLDVEGEPPDETAKRELEEEIGKRASEWRHLISYWNSPGFSDERIHVYAATGLSDVEAFEPDPEERIQIVQWPLSDLEGAIASAEDSKTLVGLLLLARERST
jgi:ADP-ribose pyrophosphatase